MFGGRFSFLRSAMESESDYSDSSVSQVAYQSETPEEPHLQGRYLIS